MRSSALYRTATVLMTKLLPRARRLSLTVNRFAARTVFMPLCCVRGLPKRLRVPQLVAQREVAVAAAQSMLDKLQAQLQLQQESSQWVADVSVGGGSNSVAAATAEAAVTALQHAAIADLTQRSAQLDALQQQLAARMDACGAKEQVQSDSL